MKNTPLKLYYAAGPGNVVASFRHWLRGEDDPGQFAMTYSGQFFDAAAEAGAEALVVSSCGRADSVSGRGMTVRNRPLATEGRDGKLDYLKRQFGAAWNLWRDLLSFRPHAAVIAEGTTFWFLIAPLRFFGIRMIPSLHCVLWPPQRRRSWKRKCFDGIETAALRFLSTACLSASGVIDRQLLPKTAPRRFLPSYRRDRFACIPNPDFDAEPFRLLYAGRIEDDKGVFDLLEAFAIARSLTDRQLHLDFCGTGSALAEVENQVRRNRLNRVVSLNGHCSFEAYQWHLGRAHAVVVPTTSRFVEGFNQVVVEGFLAGRPVIATSVCPAVHELEGGVTVVPPDSPAAIAEAIATLATGWKAGESACDRNAENREVFFNGKASWETQLRRSLHETHSAAAHSATPHRNPGTSENELPRIGYLVPEFPSQTHAFFWREITALRDAGACVELLSTRPPEPGSCRHPFGEEARRQTTYLNRLSPATLGWLLARPTGMMRAIAYVAGLRESSIAERLRCLLLIAAAGELGRFALGKQLDQVHFHSCANAAHVAALANRLCGLRYSLTLHGDLPVYGKDHASKTVRAAWVSAVTRPLRRQLLKKTGLQADQVPVVTMGVDVERFAPGPIPGDGRPPGIVTVARLIPEKGHCDALTAMSQLAAKGIDFRYTIAGDGPEREALEILAGELGLADRVTFAGNLGEDAVRELLGEAEVFLLPSYGLGEAAPVCVMEAMACGIAVVCSEIGGTPDMIEDSVDGFLTAQRQPEVLAKVLGRILTDPPLRARMGAAARLTAESRFDYRLTARQLFDRFEKPEQQSPEAIPASKAPAVVS